MLLLVNEEGYVVRAKLLKSSGFAALDKGGLEATGDLRFEPGNKDGKAVCMWRPFTFFWQ